MQQKTAYEFFVIKNIRNDKIGKDLRYRMLISDPAVSVQYSDNKSSGILKHVPRSQSNRVKHRQKNQLENEFGYR